MKKKVNGKVIDINNIKLFEAAFEGMEISENIVSNINTNISEDKEQINKFIDEYNKIYKSLPFPLYCVEDDVKYAAIGMVISERLRTGTPMCVSNALYIKTDEGKAIKFKGATWGIVKVDTSNGYGDLNIETYCGETGYREFEWVVEKMYNGESTDTYYTEFMPEFVEACNNEPVIIKWELGHMLDFGRVPEGQLKKENTILDIESGYEYTVEIFSTGTRKNGKNILVVRIDSGKSDISLKEETEAVYGFEVWQYSTDEKGDIERRKNTDMDGIAAVFEKIVGSELGVAGAIYSGLIKGNKLIFKVRNRVFMGTVREYTEPKEIARNVDVIALEGNSLYMRKQELLRSGIKKYTTYVMNLTTGSTKLCSIEFKHED